MACVVATIQACAMLVSYKFPLSQKEGEARTANLIGAGRHKQASIALTLYIRMYSNLQLLSLHFPSVRLVIRMPKGNHGQQA